MTLFTWMFGLSSTAQMAILGTSAAVGLGVVLFYHQRPFSKFGGGGGGAKWDKPNPVATFKTTLGTFKAEIYMDRVPRTASSFIDLAQSGFYNGLHFHRVIPGFMDQFGCPHSRDPNSNRVGTGGPPDGAFKNLATGEIERRFNGGNIKDENISKDSNVKGTLSCANTGQKDSNGSQMFINVNDNKPLDWFSPGPSKHPVFGKVTENYELCVQISKVPTTQDDNPVQPIMMESITVSGV